MIVHNSFKLWKGVEPNKKLNRQFYLLKNKSVHLDRKDTQNPKNYSY